MNSGCGTNDGVFKIKFEDGMEICYITPGGQVSGLTYGDRKFNMVGKGKYFFIQLTIGYSLKVCFFNQSLIQQEKASSQLASKNNLLIIYKDISAK